MKRILLTAALVLTAGLAFAQDLNDPRLALNTVPDSAHFYYYINMYPQIGQWDIKKARAKEFGYHSEYVLEGKFDRIWILSLHDAIVKKKDRYALFNLDTKKYTTKFDYTDVRFAWGTVDTAPVALYTQTKDYEGWDLWRLLDTDGKRTMEPIMTEPTDSFFFVAPNCIKLFKDGKESLIDDGGKVIVPFQYAHVGVYRAYDGVTLLDVQDAEGRWGLARVVGDGTLFEMAPCEFDAVNITRWPCLLEKDGKFAIVYDKDGSRTGLDFDSVDWYPQGMIVRIGQKFGFQKWGKLKLPVEYDSMGITTSKETKNKKAIIADKEDGVYLFDTNGKLLHFEPAEVVEPEEFEAQEDTLSNGR